MILASHYVIDDLLHILEGENIDEIKKTCEKYHRRYKDDSAFIMICNMIIKEMDDKTIEDIKSMLKELSNTRKLETSGSGELWYEDRRRRW